MIKDKYILVSLGGIGFNVANTIFQGNEDFYDQFIAVDSEEKEEKHLTDAYVVDKLENEPEKPAHEKYDEMDYSEVEQRFSGIKNENVIFVVSGKSDISGASIKILSYLKNNDLTVYYVTPDLDFLSGIVAKQEKVTRNILQQYARSGLLKEIYLFSNSSVEQAAGGIPVKNYFDSINSYIAYAANMLLYAKGREALYDNLSETHEATRIKTLGVSHEGQESLYFDLTAQRDDGIMFPSQKRYYYFLNEDRLESDKELLKNIKQEIKNRKQKLMDASYSIYDFGKEEDLILVEYCTALVQN